MWEEDVQYKERTGTDDDLDSIEHCVNSGYKYFIHFISGHPYNSSKLVEEKNSYIVVSIYFFVSIFNN